MKNATAARGPYLAVVSIPEGIARAYFHLTRRAADSRIATALDSLRMVPGATGKVYDLPELLRASSYRAGDEVSQLEELAAHTSVPIPQ